MFTKNLQKYIRSLALKKNRDVDGVFLAEGRKTVSELLGHYPCKMLIGAEDFLQSYPAEGRHIVATLDEIARASLLKSPRDVIAVFDQCFPIPDKKALSPVEAAATDLVLLLDGVQDPGNLGTIIRLADWFGIHHIVCSPHCADVFSPKVVQSTMGSLARVVIHYEKLADFLHRLPLNTPVFGTFLDGDNIYGQTLTQHGVIIMGSEGEGISPELADAVTHRLFIPSYPVGMPTGESLNVAIATAIICGEFRRRALSN